MAEILVSPGIQITETDRSAYASRPLVAGAALIGPTVKGQPNIPTKVTSYGDYVRRFGTSFELESGSVLKRYEFLTSIAAKSYFEQGGDSLLVVRVAPEGYFKAAKSTKVSCTGSASAQAFSLKTLSCGAYLNNVPDANYMEFDEDAADNTCERKDGSLLEGTVDNIRFEVVNTDLETGTFSLVIRRGDDTDKDKTVLEVFNNLSLDPNNVNYIKKVIGDQHAVCLQDDEGHHYVDVQGNYTNKSIYVYVDEVQDTPDYLLADGVTVNTDPAGVKYSDYLPVECKGGFYGGTGIVGMSTGDTHVNADYYENIKENSAYPQSVEWKDYVIPIDILGNMDEYQINIVSAPGVLDTNTNNLLVSLAESRGDCIAVVDLVNADKNTRETAEQAQKINSSYAATYYPWLQMFNSLGQLVWVPASVVIPGVYVFNDKQAAPWYAPAGMLRGGIQGVVQTKKKLTKAHRDTLYKRNVNPIATFPGSGIVIYGQKTLQKKQTALDRVNARRLLIELKKTVRDMASRLLFEHNTASVRNSFRAKLEPYLESVVQRNGLYAYKVVIDELNDNETIDRNEFRCQIYVQPTKVIEFIYIDFTITATGVEFNN